MFEFQELRRDDFALLGRWLAEPHVQRWWHHEFTPEAVERDFGPTADHEELGEVFVAALDGAPMALVQWCRMGDYPEYRDEVSTVYPVEPSAATIDYLIGVPNLVGRGVGTELIRAFVEFVWRRAPDVTHLVVPVGSANVGSWRALEKAGFRVVARGTLRPDNPADDGAHHVMRLERGGGR